MLHQLRHWGVQEDGTCMDLLGCFQEKQLTDTTERYFELLKDAKVKGYLFAQYNYIDEPYKNIKKP
jgi:hypothetical protein